MAKKKDINWLLKNYSELFNGIGITNNSIIEYQKDYQSKTSNDNVLNFLWSLFNRSLIVSAQNAKTEYDLHFQNWKLYAAMLQFRRKYEKSKANEILKLQLKSGLLMSDAQSDVKLIVEVMSGHCCEFCNSLDNKVFPIADVLKNQYLGSDSCTNPKGCNCCYAALCAKDDNGKFIMK